MCIHPGYYSYFIVYVLLCRPLKRSLADPKRPNPPNTFTHIPGKVLSPYPSIQRLICCLFWSKWIFLAVFRELCRNHNSYKRAESRFGFALFFRFFWYIICLGSTPVPKFSHAYISWTRTAVPDPLSVPEEWGTSLSNHDFLFFCLLMFIKATKRVPDYLGRISHTL
jgi:hypothetical protein